MGPYTRGWAAVLAAALVVAGYVALASCSSPQPLDPEPVPTIYDTPSGGGR